MRRVACTFRSWHRRGFALIAVLWIVAALSLIVASLSKAAVQEVRAVSSAKQSVEGESLGLAAIHLVLQEMAATSARPQNWRHVGVTYRGVEVQVRVMPVNGLIDLNNAPQALLASLFAHAGPMDSRRAAALAAAVVETRAARDARGRPIGFEAIEDLLRVPGIDYALYAKISALVTADLVGPGRVNPAAAPTEVLAVIASGDGARAADAAARQRSQRPGVDITALNGEFIDTNAYTQRFQLQARVPLLDGSWLLVMRTVDMSGGEGSLQWRVIHGESRLEPAAG